MTVQLSRIFRAALVGATSLAAISCTNSPAYNEDGNVFISPRPPKYGFRGTNSPDYAAGQGNQDKPKKSDTGEDPSKLHDQSGNTAATDTGNKPTEGAGTTTPPPATENPSSTADTGSTGATNPPAATKPNSNLPYGSPVIGKKGYVYSPYAPEKGMVDVTDIPSGTKVECPYTGKVFRVP